MHDVASREDTFKIQKPYGQVQVEARFEHHIYVFGGEWLNNAIRLNL